ncbi:MAG: myo-inosose-2 dehydratase [Geminicoccaceae bacterium]|nr:myo-inosose-2 dehydratase [Geminicoccaceae bacterium]
MADEPEARVRLGINPIGWSNDDLPELGGDIPLERCLSEARLAGYSGIEKGGKFPEDPKLLRPLLEDHGLALISGWFSGRLLELDVDREKKRMASHLRLLQEMGCPVLVYAETTGTVQNKIDVPVAERPRLEPDDLRRYGEKLTKLADWLVSEECPMVFHHHVGTVVETEAEIDLLMANTDTSVSLLFDTGHLTVAGGDLEGTFRRHAARIKHVHAKNVRAEVLDRLRARRWSFLKGVIEGVFTTPGDPQGCVDFALLGRLLAEFGYRGWLVVEAEQDPKKAEPLAYARMGIEALQKACAEAGVRIES